MIFNGSSHIINPLARERRFGFGSGVGGAASFLGAMDAYTANLVGLYSVGYRLLASYTGSLIRVRRSSDSTEQDIGYLANGKIDVASLNTFIGGGSWFLRKIYDQSGNARDMPQATAAQQPQGGVDGNSIAYCFAASGAGDNTIRMALTGLSIAATGGKTSTMSVASGTGYASGLMMARKSDWTQARQIWALGTLVFTDNQPGAGTNSSLGSLTSGNVYSMVHQTGASENRITRGTSTAATGTAAASALIIGELGIGYLSGGPQWKELSKFYAGAVWSDDVGNSTADAISDALKALFVTS